MTKRYYRETLADIDKKLNKIFEDSKDSIDDLTDLREHLEIETFNLERQKKMGRVRLYSDWSFKVHKQLIEAKESSLFNIPDFGAF